MRIRNNSRTDHIWSLRFKKSFLTWYSINKTWIRFVCQISRKKFLLENRWNFSTAQTVLRRTQCQSFAPWLLFCSEISRCKPEKFRFPQTAFERYDMLLVHDITINGNLKQSMRFDCKCAEQKQSFCNKNVQKSRFEAFQRYKSRHRTQIACR